LAKASLKKSTFYKSTFIENNFKLEQQFDYFILGSSRGLTTLNSIQIDKKMAIDGVNLSMDDTDLKTQLLMLKHFFALGHTSDYCILSLDASNFKTSPKNLGGNDYRFVPYSDKPYVKAHYSTYEQGVIRPLTHASNLPFLAFSYYNLELIYPSLYCLFKDKQRNRFDAFGNYYYPKQHIEKQALTKIPLEVEVTNPIIKEIKKVAKANNCELIVYIGPYRNYNYTISNNHSFNIINHSGKLDNNVMFYDTMHVSRTGNFEATNLFIQDFNKILSQ
jgi:hypothetical protein